MASTTTTKSAKELADEILKQNAAAVAAAGTPASKAIPMHGAPHVTTGPVGRDSQRFSLTNALLNGIGERNTDAAKFEMGVLGEFRKALIETKSLPPGGNPSAWWIPSNWNNLGDEVLAHKGVQQCRAVLEGSPAEFDPDEYAWLVRKGIIMKTQSAYTDSLGGTLRPPEQMGPVIPLIRPQAALIAAGASQMPLPPQGRYTEPRITGAPSVQAVAESQDAPESDLTTDQMELTAKKIAGMARVSEEAVAFTSGTIDTHTNEELNRSLGLKMDAYGFYGPGGTSIPAGLTSATYSAAVIDIETSYPAGRGVGTNGNVLLPEYGDLLPALIEERSFALDSKDGGWIMRPSAYASAVGARAAGPIPGDGQGPLVDILRRFSESSPQQWRGRKVTKTTNVRGDRVKGAGTALSDVFFGIWSYCVVASYGAVQFTQGHDGNTFKRGQYLIRGIMFGDVGFRYPSAFLTFKNVLGAQDQI